MMEVRGVLMSWETLVMSSVFIRSLRIRCSTAAAMPWAMWFRSSPWDLKSSTMPLVST